MVRILPTQIVVGTGKWVSINGDLGRENAELLLLNGHIGLLNKYNGRVERECDDM